MSYVYVFRNRIVSKKEKQFSLFSPGFCDTKETGSYANPDDCSKYWLCAGGKKYETQCPGGLVYNTVISSCDDPAVAKNQIALTCKHSPFRITSAGGQIQATKEDTIAETQNILNNNNKQQTDSQDMVLTF